MADEATRVTAARLADKLEKSLGGVLEPNAYMSRGAFLPAEEWRLVLSALRSETRLRIPAGWKLVPLEPTEEMLKAIANGGVPHDGPPSSHAWQEWARADWDHVLKHVPEPPAAVTETASPDTEIERLRGKVYLVEVRRVR